MHLMSIDTDLLSELLDYLIESSNLLSEFMD